jgi:hypothetical protein
MRSERSRLTLLVGGTTLVLVVLLGIRPVSLDHILAGYVLALAAIAIVALVRQLGAGGEYQPQSLFEHALSRKPEQPTRPPELVRIEREITLGTTSAGHLHTRLLPLLREAASARLGFDFELQPERARAAVGEETWELLRPDRPEPLERNAAGLPLRRIRAVVESLERL